MSHLFLFLTVLAAPLRADVSDEFEKYLNEVIPMTHQIAKQTSYVMEYSVAVNRASLAQSHLAGASREAILLKKAISDMDLTDVASLAEAKATPPDFNHSLRQIFGASQIRNIADRIRTHLKAYEAIRDGIGGPCEDFGNFSRYHVESLGFSFRIPEVGLIDGVYIVYASGSSQSNPASGEKQDSGGFEQIPLIGSLFQFGKNIYERTRIGDLVDRLNREIPKTEQYQQYAQENCRVVAGIQRTLFKVYDPLQESLQKLVDDIPVDLLKKLSKFYRARLAVYEKELHAHLRNQAEAIAKALNEEERFDAVQTGSVIASNDRMGLQIARLERSRCGDGAAPLQKLRAEMAFRKLYRSALSSSVYLRAGKTIENRLKLCGGGNQ